MLGMVVGGLEGFGRRQVVVLEVIVYVHTA